MKLIVDIPEDYYNVIKEIPVEQSTADMMIIRNGKPLPKGHGRLIDEQDAVDTLSVMFSGNDEVLNDALECIEQLPEVVEADGGSEE